MSQIYITGLLSLSSALAYLLSLTNVTVFLPQLIALLSILFFISNKYKLSTIYLISLIVCLIVFTTNGVQSPIFFLIYFLLFVVAFQSSPSVSLSFSLVLILLLSQSLNSLSSLLPLISLIFISPLAGFISLQAQKQTKVMNIVAVDETDFLFWLNLKFKTGISSIIDSTSQLLSSPNLNVSQKEQAKKIKASAKSLLTSAHKLSQEFDDNSDDI